MSRALLLIAGLGLSILAAAGPLDSYNQGVDRLDKGEIEDAISGFEEAAVSGEGPLRAAALFNLGLAHARKGDAVREYNGEEEESRDAAVRRLTAAAESYRRALALFRRVPGESADADEGAKAAKVRLLSALDELQQLADAAKKEAEEQALSNPALFLLQTLTAERDRRRAAESIATLSARRQRIPARRLRLAEFEARSLVEKLAARLEAPADPAQPGGVPPEAGKEAAESVKRAAAAMAEAEGHLDGLDGAGAARAQTRAIGELAAAARRLPVLLPQLVAKLGSDQQSLLGLTRAGESDLLTTEQSEVRDWLVLLTMLPDPAPDAPAAPGALPAETVGQVRDLAKEADAAAGRSGEHLAAGRFEESVPEQEIVIEKLEAMRELLPKPPLSPAERIRKLIDEENEVGDLTDALAGRDPAARSEEEEALGGRQTENGREAGSIAEELEASPGEREKEAAGKVREAEEEVHASSESLRRDKLPAAKESIDRAVAHLDEALRILSGEEEPDQGDQENQDQKDQGQEDQEETKEQQDARKLDSREARRMMEEMDRERREEEDKLFRGLGGPRVEKDW